MLRPPGQAGEALLAEQDAQRVDTDRVAGLGQFPLDVVDGEILLPHRDGQRAHPIPDRGRLRPVLERLKEAGALGGIVPELVTEDPEGPGRVTEAVRHNVGGGALDEEAAQRFPEAAAVADVRSVSLAPRAFRTRVGGLFLFVPLMRQLDLAAVVRQAALPTSTMIPAEQAVRTLLALKLVGKERKSHVMDLVFDPGLALFAGLNVVPKRSYLAAYSSRIDRRGTERLMATWCDAVHGAGLGRGTSIDLDFHTVPANAQVEPLEKHYVSSRSRSQKGILVFLARDATERVLCYSQAGIPKAQQPDEILRFVEFWTRHTGHPPEELVFDSQLTTYAHLSTLNQQDIRFMTLRRRSKKMLATIWSRPASAWQRITLRSLTRTFRTPKVLDKRVHLKGYHGPLRQVTVIDLGHEDPTVLLTNNLEITCPALVTRYAQRMLIENGISEAIQFFHLDALSSMVGLKVDFDLQITLMASALYRLMADRIGREYARAQAKQIFRNLLDVSATVTIADADVTVTLDKRAHNPYLVASRISPRRCPGLAESRCASASRDSAFRGPQC
jgi:hypothetical protein